MILSVDRGPSRKPQTRSNTLYRHRWIEANGYQTNGYVRELNLAYKRNGDQSKYVTEIQFPIEKRQA